ncbi:MAG: DUF2147 domain-containing protein [Acidovorax sp.]|nr:DUF2147 domain-containing protein [Acidovorax sp.]
MNTPLSSRPSLYGLWLLLALFTGASQAGSESATSPAGLWQTVDDATGKPRALVRVSIEQGTLVGTIEKSLNPQDKADARCDKCADARKGQPIIGMALLSGLKRDGSDPLLWSGGEIVDPDSGTLYRARVKLSPDGTRMEVRGFVGVSLFGRTQVWQRQE